MPLSPSIDDLIASSEPIPAYTHEPVFGSDPTEPPLSPAEEREAEEWYRDHYSFTHIRGGLCTCIGDKIDSIIAWRQGDPDLQPQDIIEVPPPDFPEREPENWDLVDEPVTGSAAVPPPPPNHNPLAPLQ